MHFIRRSQLCSPKLNLFVESFTSRRQGNYCMQAPIVPVWYLLCKLTKNEATRTLNEIKIYKIDNHAPAVCSLFFSWNRPFFYEYIKNKTLMVNEIHLCPYLHKSACWENAREHTWLMFAMDVKEFSFLKWVESFTPTSSKCKHKTPQASSSSTMWHRSKSFLMWLTFTDRTSAKRRNETNPMVLVQHTNILKITHYVDYLICFIPAWFWVCKNLHWNVCQERFWWLSNLCKDYQNVWMHTKISQPVSPKPGKALELGKDQ